MVSGIRIEPSVLFRISVNNYFPAGIALTVLMGQVRISPAWKGTVQEGFDFQGVAFAGNTANFDTKNIVEDIHRRKMAEPIKTGCSQCFYGDCAVSEQFWFKMERIHIIAETGSSC